MLLNHFLELENIIFCNVTTVSGLQKLTEQHKDNTFSLYIVEQLSILWIVSLCVWHDSQYSDPQVFLCNMTLSTVKRRVIASGLFPHTVSTYRKGGQVTHTWLKVDWGNMPRCCYPRLLLSIYTGRHTNCICETYLYKAPVADRELECKVGIWLNPGRLLSCCEVRQRRPAGCFCTFFFYDPTLSQN